MLMQGHYNTQISFDMDKVENTNEQTQKQSVESTSQQEADQNSSQENIEEQPKENSEANECAAVKEQLLRTMAEFDNYRKRTLKEKAELIKNGGERALVDLLPIIDDFDLAIKHTTDKVGEDPILEGIMIIYNKFYEYLAKQGVKAIETEGAVFDDNYHEAIAVVPAPTPEQKGKILDCVKKGYVLNEKVIRYAHVVVGE